MHPQISCSCSSALGHGKGIGREGIGATFPSYTVTYPRPRIGKNDCMIYQTPIGGAGVWSSQTLVPKLWAGVGIKARWYKESLQYLTDWVCSPGSFTRQWSWLRNLRRWLGLSAIRYCQKHVRFTPCSGVHWRPCCVLERFTSRKL